jgi:hypothetical protein
MLKIRHLMFSRKMQPLSMVLKWAKVSAVKEVFFKKMLQHFMGLKHHNQVKDLLKSKNHQLKKSRAVKDFLS